MNSKDDVAWRSTPLEQTNSSDKARAEEGVEVSVLYVLHVSHWDVRLDVNLTVLGERVEKGTDQEGGHTVLLKLWSR